MRSAMRKVLLGSIVIGAGVLLPANYPGNTGDQARADCGSCCYDKYSTCVICVDKCVVTPDAYDAGKGKCILQT